MEDFAGRYGRWALVLGGSEGVGAALADQLAGRGLDLLLVARKAGPLEQTAAAVRQAHGREVRTLAQDLTAPDALQRILDWVGDAEVGFLAYNAGAEAGFGEFLERPLADAQHMIALNVTTPVALVHPLARRMVERRRGAVVLVSSVAGSAGCPRIAAYSASKAFSNVFSEALWGELAPHGVQVLGLVLGTTRTPAMERMGLRMDATAAAPAEVAAEALAHLGDGPTWFASGTKAAADHFRSLDRGEAVRIMGSASAALE
jgi:short-subunit dehydrogenase